MAVSKDTVQQLADAWMNEIKRLQSRATCDCGCETPIPVTRFKPGHDAKLRSRYIKEIRAILGG